MNSNSLISIEPMRADYNASVSALLLEGFRGKLQRGLKQDDAQLQLLLEILLQLRAEAGTSRRLVAMRNGSVIGSLAMKWPIQQVDQRQIQLRPMLRVLREIGLAKGFSLALRLACLSHRPVKGESYITDVAVHAQHRGAGVGRKMLESALSEASACPGIRYASLHVAGSNVGAKRLYEQLGFRTQKVERSMMMEWLFGEPDWNYMIREW